MKLLSVFLLCFILAVSCQTAEVTEAPVIEKYVLSSSSKESDTAPEETHVQEEIPPVQSSELESSEVQETPEKKKPATKKEKKAKNREDTVVYEKVQEKKEEHKKEEDTVIVLEDQNNSNTQESSLFEVVSESNVQERQITGEKSIKERLGIFFNNNKLYCIGIITMLLGSVFLTITVVTHPVEKYIKAVNYKKDKEKKKETVTKKKSTETYEGDSSDPVITNEDFLKTLLKS